MNDTTSGVPQNYAGFWVRFGSLAIDGLVLGAVCVFFNIILIRLIHAISPAATALKFSVLAILLVALLMSLAYFSWFSANGRQTAGKKFFGLLVVDAAMQPLSFAQSLRRAAAYIVDVTGILLVPFNKKKRALHDLLAKTFVVRIRAPRRSEALLIFAVLAGNFFLGIPLRLALRSHLQAFRIPTGGFKSTILIGDYILVDKYWAKNHAPERGDIVVFKYPQDPSLEYIKRCIGLPGDTVAMRDGVVWLNGEQELLQFPRREYDPEEGHFALEYEVKWEGRQSYRIRHYEDHTLTAENYGPVIVPPNHYFVMGDNRDNSSDSRHWGFLPRENIVGKAGVIYLSWDRAAPIYRPAAKIRWSRIGKVLQ